jgi:UDP-glucuronate decarboxylase
MKDYNENKRILVTGGAGFLGSHLIDRLIDRGDEVICLDNLFTGSKKNIEHHFKNPKFEFIRHDVTVPISIEVDQIYNLACPASPIHYQHDPIQTIKTSVLGAMNMLELAKRLNAKILQASTSEVYGDPVVHPQSENYWGNVNPIGIRSCYDEGKRCAETVFFDYYRQYNLDIRVVRIFNTYGPRMHPKDGRVVSNFVMQALKGEDITIYGQGMQTRSFCYVDNLIEGFIRFMDMPQNVSDNFSYPGPLNLGNPNEFTIKDLAKEIIYQTNSKSKIVYCDLPSDDPTQRKPNIELAKQYLDNWSPSIELKEGLEKTIQYFKSLL